MCERANDCGQGLRDPRGFPFVSNASLTGPGLRLVFVGTHRPYDSADVTLDSLSRGLAG